MPIEYSENICEKWLRETSEMNNYSITTRRIKTTIWKSKIVQVDRKLNETDAHDDGDDDATPHVTACVALHIEHTHKYIHWERASWARTVLFFVHVHSHSHWLKFEPCPHSTHDHHHGHPCGCCPFDLTSSFYLFAFLLSSFLFPFFHLSDEQQPELNKKIMENLRYSATNGGEGTCDVLYLPTPSKSSQRGFHETIHSLLHSWKRPLRADGALGLVSLGPTVGAPSCLVPQPRRLLRRCSIAAATQGQMATFLARQTFLGTFCRAPSVEGREWAAWEWASGLLRLIFLLQILVCEKCIRSVSLLLFLRPWLWDGPLAIGCVRSISLLTELSRYDSTEFSTLHMLLWFGPLYFDWVEARRHIDTCSIRTLNRRRSLSQFDQLQIAHLIKSAFSHAPRSAPSESWDTSLPLRPVHPSKSPPLQLGDALCWMSAPHSNIRDNSVTHNSCHMLWEGGVSPRGNTPHCAWVQWF